MMLIIVTGLASAFFAYLTYTSVRELLSSLKRGYLVTKRGIKVDREQHPAGFWLCWLLGAIIFLPIAAFGTLVFCVACGRQIAKFF